MHMISTIRFIMRLLPAGVTPRLLGRPVVRGTLTVFVTAVYLVSTDGSGTVFFPNL